MFAENQRLGATAALLLLTASLPALAGSRIEREFELRPGGELIVDTDNGSVQVEGVSGSKATVLITSRSDDMESRYDFQFSSDPGRLEIDVERKGKLRKMFDWGRGGNLKFVIRVPTDTAVNLDTAGGSIKAYDLGQEAILDTSGGSITAERIRGDLLADTSGGSIVAEDIDGDVEADTSGGSISIHGVRGDVSADTSGGSIKISDVTGEVSADTSGGSIIIDGVGGHVSADTSGGSIEVTFLAGNSSGGELATSGGGILVYIDPEVNLEVDAVASGGSVEFNIPITVQGRISKSTVRGKIGSGGAMLRLRASGGKIRINPR